MQVKIITDMGENKFELKDTAVFSLLSTALALQNGSTATASAEETVVTAHKSAAVTRPVQKSRVDSMFGSDWKKSSDERIPYKKPEVYDRYDEEGYKGFLIVKCEHCGEEKGYCSKVPLRYHKCQCGESTKLTGLRKVFIRCECGSSYKYQTNITDDHFTFNCLNCGSPVELQYNSKKNVYQNM